MAKRKRRGGSFGFFGALPALAGIPLGVKIAVAVLAYLALKKKSAPAASTLPPSMPDAVTPSDASAAGGGGGGGDSAASYDYSYGSDYSAGTTAAPATYDQMVNSSPASSPTSSPSPVSAPTRVNARQGVPSITSPTPTTAHVYASAPAASTLPAFTVPTKTASLSPTKSYTSLFRGLGYLHVRRGVVIKSKYHRD